MKESSYQKKKRQLSEANQEIYKLKKLIRDVVNGEAKHIDLTPIALEFDFHEQLERVMWQGNKQNL